MYENKYFSIQPVTKTKSKNILLTILVVALLGILAVYLNPTVFFFEIFNIPTINGCPLLTFTGIPCPFCGMGRVFSCMTDFYIARSFYYNPLGLIFYIIFALSLGFIALLALKKRRIAFKIAGAKLIWVPVGFIIIMWILNILYGHHR